jgi:uracil-DNA glycosylase
MALAAAASGLRELADEAAERQRCPLYVHATRTAFGEGPPGAAIMLLGRPVVLASVRGKLLLLANGHRCLATMHLSALLRMADAEARPQAFASLVGDLRRSVTLSNASATSAEPVPSG